MGPDNQHVSNNQHQLSPSCWCHTVLFNVAPCTAVSTRLMKDKPCKQSLRWEQSRSPDDRAWTENVHVPGGDLIPCWHNLQLDSPEAATQLLSTELQAPVAKQAALGEATGVAAAHTPALNIHQHTHRGPDTTKAAEARSAVSHMTGACRCLLHRSCQKPVPGQPGDILCAVAAAAGRADHAQQYLPQHLVAQDISWLQCHCPQVTARDHISSAGSTGSTGSTLTYAGAARRLTSAQLLGHMTSAVSGGRDVQVTTAWQEQRSSQRHG